MEHFNIDGIKESFNSALSVIQRDQKLSNYQKNIEFKNPIIIELKAMQVRLEKENENSIKLLELKNNELEELKIQNEKLQIENKKSKRNFWISFVVGTILSITAIIIALVK